MPKEPYIWNENQINELLAQSFGGMSADMRDIAEQLKRERDEARNFVVHYRMKFLAVCDSDPALMAKLPWEQNEPNH